MPDATSSQVSERREAQKQLYLDGLAQLLDVASRLQNQVLRSERLDTVHLVFLRRARANQYVSFDRVRADRGLPRYFVSRAAAALEKLRLGVIKPLDSDTRHKRFVIHAKGRECLNRVEIDIAKKMLKAIQVTGPDSKRFYLFTVHLYNLVRLLPDYVGGPNYIASKIGIYDQIAPEEKDIKDFELALAAKPRPVLTPARELTINWFR